MNVDVLTDAQVEQLRALPHLTQLSSCLSTIQLCRFLRTPHTLRWQSLMDYPVEVNAELSLLLPSLPSLALLSVNLLADCSPVFFSRLTNLVELALQLDDFTDPAALDSLASSLQTCTQITDLSLFHGLLTADQMSVMLSQCTDLCALHLSDASELDSLRFLSSGSIPRTLTSLTLEMCKHLPLVELQHVHALQSLERLCVYYSFAEKMDEHTLAPYQPPSLLLPNLRTLKYYP